MGLDRFNRARDYEKANFLEDEPLNVGAKAAALGKQIPRGFGLVKMNLQIDLSLTVGTASGPISGGELDIIENITLKDSGGNLRVDLGARPLYEFATRFAGSPPAKDAIAAATAVYRVNLPIWFVIPGTERPHDTMIDSSKFDQFNLSVKLGDVDKLFTTPGTASLTATIRGNVIRTREKLPDDFQPIGYLQYVAENPVDASTDTVINLTRDDSLAIAAYLIHCSASATVGEEFSGTDADDVIDLFEFKDGADSFYDESQWEAVQRENKDEFGLEAIRTGYIYIDFTTFEDSINNFLDTALMSNNQLKWTNVAGVAANDQVSVARLGFRPFPKKAAA